jgi:hypothetical protein
MAKVKKDEKQTGKQDVKSDTLWRKPITLDSFEDEDPLAALYLGREVGTKNAEKISPEMPKAKPAKSTAKKTKNSKKPDSTANPKKTLAKQTSESAKVVNHKKTQESKETSAPKLTEKELKNLLKIKSEFFQFTDIREILRGNSFDIYAYLRYLAGDAGVCKIKHLDLMQILDISRPTLFKQSDWLTQLSLIEKWSVPGDHLGTSYTVHRLEDVLPVSNMLVEQVESHIKTIKQESD